MPRSCSSSATSFYGSGNGYNTRSMTPNRSRSDSAYSKGYGGRTPVNFSLTDELVGEPVDTSRSVDSILVTIQFRPLRTCICFCIRRSSEIHFLVKWFPTEEKISSWWMCFWYLYYSVKLDGLAVAVPFAKRQVQELFDPTVSQLLNLVQLVIG